MKVDLKYSAKVILYPFEKLTVRIYIIYCVANKDISRHQHFWVVEFVVLRGRHIVFLIPSCQDQGRLKMKDVLFQVIFKQLMNNSFLLWIISSYKYI